MLERIEILIRPRRVQEKNGAEETFHGIVRCDNLLQSFPSIVSNDASKLLDRAA